MSLSPEAAKLLAVAAMMVLLPVVCIAICALLAWTETHGKVTSKGGKH